MTESNWIRRRGWRIRIAALIAVLAPVGGAFAVIHEASADVAPVRLDLRGFYKDVYIAPNGRSSGENTSCGPFDFQWPSDIPQTLDSERRSLRLYWGVNSGATGCYRAPELGNAAPYEVQPVVDLSFHLNDDNTVTVSNVLVGLQSRYCTLYYFECDPFETYDEVTWDGGTLAAGEGADLDYTGSDGDPWPRVDYQLDLSVS